MHFQDNLIKAHPNPSHIVAMPKGRAFLLNSFGVFNPRTSLYKDNPRSNLSAALLWQAELRGILLIKD
jgi:hypothetical protein